MTAKNTATHRYGRVSVTAPTDWADETTIVLTSPTRQGLSAPLSGKAAPSFRETLTVTNDARTGDITDPATYLQRMTSVLRQSGVAVEELDLSPFDFTDRKGACMERRVELNGTVVRQLTGAVFVDERVVVATASTLESQAVARRDAIRELLAGVRAD